MSFLALVVGVAAGAIGASAYHTASAVRDDLRTLKAASEKPADEDLGATMRRLEARVSHLERDRLLPREPAAAPAANPAPAPPADPSTDPVADDPVPPTQDKDKRAAMHEHVPKAVNAYWTRWGAKNGLTAAQTEQLATIQAEAARRRVDDHDKLTDGTISRAQGKADLDAMVADVRQKAKALLTPDQFAKFEAEKGAEWGSSYRKVREMSAKDRAADPAP